MLGKDVALRTRRALSLYKVYGDSALLVLNWYIVEQHYHPSGSQLTNDRALLHNSLNAHLLYPKQNLQKTGPKQNQVINLSNPYCIIDNSFAHE